MGDIWIFKKYNELSVWLKWLIVFPVSIVGTFACVVWYRMAVALYFPGIPERVVQVLYDNFAFFVLLLFICRLIPRGKRIVIFFFFGVGVLFLVSMIVFLSIDGKDFFMQFTWIDGFLGCCINILISWFFIKSAASWEKEYIEKRIKYIFFGGMFCLICILIDISLELLSRIPIIGGFFSFIRHLREIAQ